MERLKDRSSVKKIIGQMTLEEKAGALTGGSLFFGTGLEKYGIPSLYFLDGGTGANYFQMYLDCFCKNHKMSTEGGSALFDMNSEAQAVPELLALDADEQAAAQADEKTRKEVAMMKEKMKAYIPGGVMPGCFPPGILLGATWDGENIRRVGRALGKEANYYGVDVLLGTPNVNIHRDPLGGRLFEGYSEDPCLVAQLAPELVKGVQEEGVLVNPKHFAANNQETDRWGVDETVQKRALYEIYFPGFRACIQEGKSKTVMSAYNAINGECCAMNRWLLTDVLRGEWGFEGFVVSDWGGAYDQAEALRAGNDYDMPGPRSIAPIVEAVKSGRLPEKVLDTALERVLNMMLEAPAMTGKKTEKIDIEDSRQAAYDAAKEGIVLLKNEGGTLPFSTDANISFFGGKSKKFIESGGGSANVITDRTSNVYDCSRTIAGDGRVRFGEITDDTDAVVVTVGVIGQEGFDRASLSIDAEDEKMLKETLEEAKRSGKKTVVILNVCGPVDVREFIDDTDALLCVFIPGMEGGRAAADILYGRVNPSGKLPLTFPKRYEDCPTYGNFPGRGAKVMYGEGIFVGYRYYDMKNIEPMFPFGFGLSYTQFGIGHLHLDRDCMNVDREGDDLSATVKVKNTGRCGGKEVVQLYIAQEKPTLLKPPKELKAFRKVRLEPVVEKDNPFTVTAEMLPRYDDGTEKWQIEPGYYKVLVGNSARNICAEASFEVKGYNPYGVNEDTPLGKLVMIPGALDELMKHCPEGRLTRESVELSILFAATGKLSEYWDKVIAPAMEGIGDDEKQRRYEAMLAAMNRFH